MQQSQTAPMETQRSSTAQLVIYLIGLLATAAFFYWGFDYLRDNSGSEELTTKTLVTVFAIIWGVGGVALFYFLLNGLVETFPDRLKQYILPYVFVGPAVLFLFYYLALPAFRTFYISLYDRTGASFVGLDNYVTAFTSRIMVTAFRNNLLWILFGATSSVLFGLLIAVLADRSKYERLAKSLIFLPMAISFVGAGVIWNFIYEVRDASPPQIGLLNAIVVAFGGEPQAWTALLQPWNNLFLIVIVIWLQTGFAMVLFSAALKGIPDELLEAARVDGANEIQIFMRVMIPYIMGTIITVSTTVVIFTLKIFDVVFVMTGGQFNTQVIATQFYREYFINQNDGLGSAIAVILLIAVVPVMIYNLRQFSQNRAF